MSKGMLIDITKCTACRGCQVACKQWNEKPAETTAFNANWTNPPDLSSKTWTVVDSKPPATQNGSLQWRFVRQLCLHCLEPACASVCPVGALHKTSEGPVVYNADKCIGCRYCMVACPFQVPKFEWEKAIPVIQKCQFCFDRISRGQQPACAKACPTQAVLFGERDELLHQAHSRIYARPDKYVDHIYGEKEVGGTSIMYVSDVSFEELGFRQNLGTEPLPEKTWESLRIIPLEAIGIIAAMGGIWYLIKRRANAMAHPVEGDTSHEKPS